MHIRNNPSFFLTNKTGTPQDAALETNEELAKKVQEEEQTKVLEQQEQERANLEAALNLQKQFDQERKAADDINWSKTIEKAQERQSGSIIRYHSFKKKPVTVAQARKNMMIYLKNMANYKMKYFKGMSYNQIRPIFEEEYRKVQTLFKKDSEDSKSEKKRVAEEALLQESFKKLRTAKASGSEPFHQEKSTEEPKELSEEDLKKMLEIVPIEDLGVGNITEAYQGFEDMLKAFEREDFDTLWSLVKEKFRSVKPTKEKERALCVNEKNLCNLIKRIHCGNYKDICMTFKTWRFYDVMAYRKWHVEKKMRMAIDNLVKKIFHRSREDQEANVLKESSSEPKGLIRQL
ncbi:hypothetical protein Tco_0621619 [Tanacetum coccineum]